MNVMKQEELVRLIREPIQTQRLMQKDIAAHCGITSAMLSNVMAGRTSMREERWRLACEYCGIDYDAFMGYSKQSSEGRPVNKASLPEGGGSAIGADGGSAPVPSDILPQHKEEQGGTTMPEIKLADCTITLTAEEAQLLLSALRMQVNAYVSTDSPDFDTLRSAFRLYDRISAGGGWA